VLDVEQSETYEHWFTQLKRKEKGTAIRIDQRIQRLANGNPGDVGPIGDGLRSCGSRSARLVGLKDGTRLMPLLAAGGKASQQKDIEEAHRVAAEWRTQQASEGHDNG